VRTWEFLGNGGRVGFASYGHNNWYALYCATVVVGSPLRLFCREEHEKGKKHGMIEALIKGAFNNVHTLMSSMKLVCAAFFLSLTRLPHAVGLTFLFLIPD
jgi:hypothetical protein